MLCHTTAPKNEKFQASTMHTSISVVQQLPAIPIGPRRCGSAQTWGFGQQRNVRICMLGRTVTIGQVYVTGVIYHLLKMLLNWVSTE